MSAIFLFAIEISKAYVFEVYLEVRVPYVHLSLGSILLTKS